MKVSDFDFFLPEELIAQQPIEPRDHSRLLVMNRHSGALEHRQFYNCIEYLEPGDVLVVNKTRVLPARLFGEKVGTGAKIEIVLLKRVMRDRWEVLIRPGKRVQEGTIIRFGAGELEAVALNKTEAGGRIVDFKYAGVFEEVLDKLGQMPLPHYIRQQLEDKERYQTVYAEVSGSAAAPTAGLHFTPELLGTIRDKGVHVAELVLHVGLGTFRPVQVEHVRDHVMHSEYYQVTPDVANMINQRKQKGGKIVAVGTTCCRTLETVSDKQGQIVPGEGWTDIFIFPGYEFKVVDRLITNFHLPKSSLVMLVSAFAGREQVMQAYETAIEAGYRFFSFGDAMFII